MCIRDRSLPPGRTAGWSRSAPRSPCPTSAPNSETRAGRLRECTYPEAGPRCAAGLPEGPGP
eukprot:11055257-Alexandrium_andersonii.AAC.1